MSAPSNDDPPEGLTEEGYKLFLKAKLLVAGNQVEDLIDNWHNAQLMHPERSKLQQELESSFLFPLGHYVVLNQYCKACAVCRATKHHNRLTAGNAVYKAIPESRMGSFSWISLQCRKSLWKATSLTVSFWQSTARAHTLGSSGDKIQEGRQEGHARIGAASQERSASNDQALVDGICCPSRDMQQQVYTVRWRMICTMCKYMGVRHARTVAYHSRSNGRAAVAGRQLLDNFWQLHIEERGRNWYHSLWRLPQTWHNFPRPCGLCPHPHVLSRE